MFMSRVRSYLEAWVLTGVLTFLILLFMFIFLQPVRGADDTDVKVALALATATHKIEQDKTSTVPLAPGQFRATDGSILEVKNGYWQVVKPQQTVGVGVPTTSSFRGGCGCQSGYNCGASFCKARGGSGCPESCPVKK